MINFTNLFPTLIAILGICIIGVVAIKNKHMKIFIFLCSISTLLCIGTYVLIDTKGVESVKVTKYDITDTLVEGEYSYKEVTTRKSLGIFYIENTVTY